MPTQSPDVSAAIQNNERLRKLGVCAPEQQMGIAIDDFGLAQRACLLKETDLYLDNVSFGAVTVVRHHPLITVHNKGNFTKFFKWVVLGETFSHAFHAATPPHESLVILRVPVPRILNSVKVLVVVLLRVQGLARGCEWGRFFWGKAQKQQRHNVAGAQKTCHCLTTTS